MSVLVETPRRRVDRRRETRLRTAADGVVARYLLDAVRGDGARRASPAPAILLACARSSSSSMMSPRSGISSARISSAPGSMS